jgi:hypothetical protein
LFYYNHESPKTWEQCKPGWYEFKIYLNDSVSHELKYIESIIDWVYNNIDKCERHARWAVTNESFNIKFRYQRDYMMFVLRWS